MTKAPVSRRLARTALAILVQAAAILAPVAARAAPEPGSRGFRLRRQRRPVAVVIGNRSYKADGPVDYAHNDAEAMRAYLVQRLGYREANIFVLKDATLNEFNQVVRHRAQPAIRPAVAQRARGSLERLRLLFGPRRAGPRQPPALPLPEDGNPNQGRGLRPRDALPQPRPREAQDWVRAPARRDGRCLLHGETGRKARACSRSRPRLRPGPAEGGERDRAAGGDVGRDAGETGTRPNGWASSPAAS